MWAQREDKTQSYLDLYLMRASPPKDLAATMDTRRDKLMFFAGTMDGIGGPQVGSGYRTDEHTHIYGTVLEPHRSLVPISANIERATPAVSSNILLP